MMFNNCEQKRGDKMNLEPFMFSDNPIECGFT
jgi:hypothetical protein